MGRKLCKKIRLGFGLGFSQAWPLLTIGLSALILVAIVTFLMILINVILPRRQRRKCNFGHIFILPFFNISFSGSPFDDA